MDITNNRGLLEPQLAAEKAVWAIGSGYDVCSRDIRLSGCKSKIAELDWNHTRELVFPGEIVVPNVPTTIKCHQGERFRNSSGVLSFEQVLLISSLLTMSSGSACAKSTNFSASKLN